MRFPGTNEWAKFALMTLIGLMRRSALIEVK